MIEPTPGLLIEVQAWWSREVAAAAVLLCCCCEEALRRVIQLS